MNNYTSNIVYGSDTVQQEIILRNDTFSKLLQSQVMMKNYNFNLIKNEPVNFPERNKYITLTNIKFTKNPTDFSMSFLGQKYVVFKNITIENLIFTGTKPFFKFKGIDNILIDTFTLSNSEFRGSECFLFQFDNVVNIEIKRLNIVNVTITQESIAQYLFIITNTISLKFTQSNFKNILSQNQVSRPLIKLYGILDCFMSIISLTTLSGVTFFNSENFFGSTDQTVFLYSDQQLLDNMYFQNITNYNKSLISFTGNKFKVQKSIFNQIICNKCVGSSIQVYKTKNFTLLDSTFKNNVGNEGGAIAVIECMYQSLQILSCDFQNCRAQAHGGAIYSYFSDILVNSTTIQNCYALIGGGIRYLGIEPKFVFYQNLYKQKQESRYFINNNISDNTAQIYGQNIGSYLKTIEILIKSSNLTHHKQRILETDNFNLDLYSLSNFQSSSEISFEFQILDQELNPLFFDHKMFENNQYPQIIQNEITLFNIKSTPGTDDVKIFGQYIADYFQFNQATQTFSINQMSIIANPSTSNFIYFESPSIKKVINPTENSRQFSDGPFHIKLNIQFRECIRGEVYKKSGSILYCSECKEGSYSIVEPLKEESESQLCLRCPDEASYCFRDQMTLFPGYWKSGNDTDQIVYCASKPENCEGPEEFGYCIEGHIGALCESCDVYGKVWQGQYQNDGKFGCIDCNKLRTASYVVPTTFIALVFVLLYQSVD